MQAAVLQNSRPCFKGMLSNHSFLYCKTVFQGLKTLEGRRRIGLQIVVGNLDSAILVFEVANYSGKGALLSLC